MRCPPRRHLLGLPTHATQQYLDLQVQRDKYLPAAAHPHHLTRILPLSPFPENRMGRGLNGCVAGVFFSGS
jgi:hypothetical protein